MALDGAFIYKIKEELSEAVSMHVDKIYQPSKDVLVFLLRGKGEVRRLYISAKPGKARVNFTDYKPENPENPPMFCMLLRKHLNAARITDVIQEGLERVITFTFSTSNELGDIIEEKLVIELIGNSPNIILLDQNGRIADAVRRSDVETAKRIIHPGAVYTYPDKTSKYELLTDSAELITKEILSYTQTPVFSAIMKSINGLSPLICREMALNFCNEFDKPVSELKNSERANIIGTVNKFANLLRNSDSAVLLYDSNGEIKEFSFTDIKQYGNMYTKKSCPGFSAALDEFYSEKDKAESLKKASSDMLRVLASLYSRTDKKLAIRLEELKATEDREKFRIYGELIKANIYMIEKGASSCRVVNYYSENGEYITIPLDSKLSPAANSAKYFKEYKKTYSAAESLKKLTEEDRKDLKYIDSVLDELSRAQNIAEINAIREELYSSGLLTKPDTKKKPNKPLKEEFIKENFGGFEIMVGKNNRQNDEITLKIASKNDLWFHVKDYPGSHTVIFTDNKTVPDNVILHAATLAAAHSKAGITGKTAVDYTLIRYVKKPSGAKPGMVTYSNQKTVFV